MPLRAAALLLGAAVAGCATVAGPQPSHQAAAPAAATPVEVQILAFNDFHGHLEPLQSSQRVAGTGTSETRVTEGGVAYLAGMLDRLRTGRQHSITVSAGDLIGGSPLPSALFLDEPTILAMNRLRLDLNAVGNHEFDRGTAELLRMQSGGCEKNTLREPCAVEKFSGATFQFLAGNTLRADGTPLLPATALRSFGPITIGFIGLTLKETATLVTPAGVQGLTFADEAATANALVPQLTAAGADAIVLLIHQGGRLEEPGDDLRCPSLTGPIVEIASRLDAEIDIIISGHTHASYVCEIAIAGSSETRLLTSAGRYGTQVTDIRLNFDPSAQRLVSKAARQELVAAGASANEGVGEIVERYTRAAQPLAERVVARLPWGVTAEPDEHGATRLGELIADAQLAWTRASDKGSADLALMNRGGVRAPLEPSPDGSVTYGQLFAIQPFGNGIVVQTLTGAQLKRLLEQQFTDPANPKLLSPSQGFAFAYDLARPEGDRIVSMTLKTEPVLPEVRYRVATNSFLASGGDGFTVLMQGTGPLDAGVDLDALEAYIAGSPRQPQGDRVRSSAPTGDAHR